MAISVKDLREWLACAPDDAWVGISDGDLLVPETGACCEVGAAPFKPKICYRCEARIFDAEYLVDSSGVRHFCCPVQ